MSGHARGLRKELTEPGPKSYYVVGQRRGPARVGDLDPVGWIAKDIEAAFGRDRRSHRLIEPEKAFSPTEPSSLVNTLPPVRTTLPPKWPRRPRNRPRS